MGTRADIYFEEKEKKEQTMENKWLEQFLANYNGTSAEAKSLEKELQKNYKGNSYVGWATMERLTYQQDPFATFEVVINPINNTPLFSAIDTISSYSRKEIKGETDTVNTENARVINFVRVKLTFLDKVFVEDYPIQDKSYQAPKFVDSNDVNKAIQRAKAKVASRGTGLALKLYEGNDLQFDPQEEVVKRAIPTPVQEVKQQNNVKELAQDLIDNFEIYLKGIKQVNAILIKKYNMTLEPNDDLNAMITKLNQIPNVDLTIAQIKRLAKE